MYSIQHSIVIHTNVAILFIKYNSKPIVCAWVELGFCSHLNFLSIEAFYKP